MGALHRGRRLCAIFDLATGQPLKSVAVPGSTILNGIAVTEDGTVYASNTCNPELIYKITADDEVSVFAEEHRSMCPMVGR